MLTLEQKKLKKKILDNLVIHIGDIIKTERNDVLKKEIVPVFGVYAGHVDVNFKDEKVTIDYYATDTTEQTYFGPKELFAGGQIFEVKYAEILKPKIASAQKQKEMYDKARETGKGKKENYSG